MNFYIKLENGMPSGHPILEDNLLQVLEVSSITNSILAQSGYAKFEHRPIPAGEAFIRDTNTYTIDADGIVRNTIITKVMSQEEKINEWVRRPRDFYLNKSDWTQMPDSPLTEEKKAEWAAYREQLRNLPFMYANIQKPDELIPPVEPTNGTV